MSSVYMVCKSVCKYQHNIVTLYRALKKCLQLLLRRGENVKQLYRPCSRVRYSCFLTDYIQKANQSKRLLNFLKIFSFRLVLGVKLSDSCHFSRA